MEQSLGTKIAAARKEKQMTQLELAQIMGVTDKAVSKWERDLSCPDIGSIPKLAQALDLSLEELMNVPGKAENTEKKEQIRNTVHLILKAVALAMGVGCAVLGVLKQITLSDGFIMLGISCACLAVLQMEEK